jgi:Uma2 family endonuclease
MSTITEPRTRTYTPEDLLALPDGDRYELVDGTLVELNVSALSSLIGFELGSRLRDHCKVHAPAWIFGADCGFQCFPGHPRKVRKPDVALILRDRLPAEQLTEGFLTLPPDLAVEVVSPNDLAVEVEEKVEEYLDAGVRLVWVVYPSTRTIHVNRGDRSSTVVRSSDELSGEDLLPGFRCRVGDLFAGLPPAAPALPPTGA